MGWLISYVTQLGIASIIPAHPDPQALWELQIFTLGLVGALLLIAIAICYIQRSDAEEQNIQNFPNFDEE